ncbi:MAG: nucleoside recognition protein [Bacteroidales bacterium]|nr:nucleoside recognition protein [Bacteroidales bacterium]
MTARALLDKLWASVKAALPAAAKICLWMIEVTAGVSFAIFLLKYFGVLQWLSVYLEPLFKHFGLPGAASLAWVSGYFVNCYSAIAAGVTMGLDVRQMTILAVMALCAHNMPIEVTVQKKTGTSAVLMIVVRTVSSIVMGLLLNLVLPAWGTAAAAEEATVCTDPFWTQFLSWLLGMLHLALKMTCIIFLLNILQQIIADSGAVEPMSRFLAPLMKVFGLPASTAFFWVVANIIGLAYGGAAMMKEAESGKLSQHDIDLINLHVGVSHSNLEDLILFSLAGGVWWVILFSRWILSAVIVWIARGVYALRDGQKVA